MKISTIFGFIIFVCLCHTSECGPNSGWHVCNDKCYHFGKYKMPFDAVTDYCNSLSGSSPVDLGLKSASSIATLLRPCRIAQKDNEPYWINKVSNMCRTIIFDGFNVFMNDKQQCRSIMYPVCEKEKSFCKASNTSHKLNHNWVRVAGQRSFYMLSHNKLSYCDARYMCEKTLGGQMLLAGGDNPFMGLLALELGIQGQMRVDIWLDSPDVSCPLGMEAGTVVQYAGPYVHIGTSKSAQFESYVLCMSDNPSSVSQSLHSTHHTRVTSTVTSKSTETRVIPGAHLPNVLPPTSIQAPTYLVTRQSHTSSRTFQAPISSNVDKGMKQTRTTSSNIKQLTSLETEQTRISSKSTKSTQTPATHSTQQAYQTVLKIQQTDMLSSMKTQTPASSFTQTRSQSLSSIQPRPLSQNPNRMQSQSNFASDCMSKRKKGILAVSKTSGEPVWLKGCKREYFLNYNSSILMENYTINYFRIFSNPASKVVSFWTGANIIIDKDLSETDVDLIHYENELVKFKLSKQDVQSMWKQLRQERNTSPSPQVDK